MLWGAERRRVVAIALVVVVAAVGASCSSGTKSSTKHVLTAPDPAGLLLARVVITPPPGFRPSTDADAINSALTARQFNDFLSEPSAANRAHLTAGYQATFDSIRNLDSILIVIAQLKSAADAQLFTNLSARDGMFRASRADPTIAPRISTVRGIPGSALFEPTKPDTQDKTYDNAFVAVKGSRVLFIDYITYRRGRVPMLARIAKQQYARL